MTSDAIYVSSCPSPTCSAKWTSDPLGSVEQALEALRGHINGHAHAELVAFIVGAHGRFAVTRYERKDEVKA